MPVKMDRDNGGDDGTGWNCSIHPSVFFLMGTLAFTGCATGMLCGAIMTDFWEEVAWDAAVLDAVTNTTTITTWYLEGLVARVSSGDQRDRTLAFLAPQHGGIWTMCYSLTDEEIISLKDKDFPQIQPCVNYLAKDGVENTRSDFQANWQSRMQNLSISCALVCLIILGSAALVGTFGLLKRQISAVLVTGVMYLLAASFALFTLTIIHFKRMQGKSKTDPIYRDGSPDGIILIDTRFRVKEILQARIITTSWSLDLGWGGVIICVMSSVLWILLSKIMRINPLSSMLS